MKQIVFLVVFVSALFSGRTQTVSVEEAMNAAQNFLGKNQKSAMNCAKVAKQGNDTLLYVFNTDRAFVVVSATKKTVPILAYSEERIYDDGEVIPPVAMWLNSYQNQIARLKNETASASPQAAKSWERLLIGKNQKSGTDEVLPFLRSRWGQGKLYNYYCPKDDSSSNNGRAVTGCVATAMAQLMYYFRFPQSGTGSYTYQHDKYGTLSANFATAKYDYAQMCDAPFTTNAAISLLMHHCGVAVDMVYGHSSSGMYNHKAAYALKTYFNYSPKTAYVFRDENPTLNWDSLIVWHLERKIPLYYAGWSEPPTSGHAFICDGYQKDEQENYYYHFDFGWDGNQNGYFYTDAIMDFNLAQELIIHAYPDTLKQTYPQPYNLSGRDTLTSESGSFTDGSGIFKQNAANRDFTWVILPDAEVIERIRFAIHYQLSANDTIFIETDGTGTANYIFTDTSASFAANVNSRKIVVRLKTTSGDGASGIFSSSYSCDFPTYCSGLETKVQATGTLSDGSGSRKYNNMTNCEKRIVPSISAGYTSVTVDFTKFETEKDKDFLYFYDFSKNPRELLLSLSGTLEKTSYTFYTRTLAIVFETDERNVFDGWELNYTAGFETSPNNIATYGNTFKIYPNPTDGKLTIRNEESGMSSEIEVFDAVGRKILSHSPLTPHSSPLIEIDVSHLPAGVYTLRVYDSEAKVVHKVYKLIKM